MYQMMKSKVMRLQRNMKNQTGGVSLQKGGQRVGCTKDEKQFSNGKSNNRHKLFEVKDEVDEDENKSASDSTS